MMGVAVLKITLSRDCILLLLGMKQGMQPSTSFIYVMSVAALKVEVTLSRDWTLVLLGTQQGMHAASDDVSVNNRMVKQ